MPEEFVEERMQAVPARLVPPLLHVEIAPRQLLKYLLGISRRDAVAERAAQTGTDPVDDRSAQEEVLHGSRLPGQHFLDEKVHDMSITDRQDRLGQCRAIGH